MDAFKFLDVDVDSARYSEETVSELQERVNFLFSALGKEVTQPDTAELFGLTITVQQGGRSALISSPFGTGRIVFTPRIGDKYAYANIEIQKSEFDGKDEHYWRRVTSFRISRGGLISNSQGEELSSQSLRALQVPFAIAAGIAAALGT